jgi:hypothetical protein
VLAHNAVIVGIPVDPVALYETEDRAMLIWLSELISRVRRTQEEATKKA